VARILEKLPLMPHIGHSKMPVKPLNAA
jgi:hypothetical protein